MCFRELDEDYWSKMKHLMKYIIVTKEFHLILGANRMGMLKYWIDEYYRVHTNMRG